MDMGDFLVLIAIVIGVIYSFTKGDDSDTRFDKRDRDNCYCDDYDYD